MEYRKNQNVIVTIEDIGMNGEGIGRVGGYTLFVKDAIVGDEVEASLTKVKKTYAYARVVKRKADASFCDVIGTNVLEEENIRKLAAWVERTAGAWIDK